MLTHLAPTRGARVSVMGVTYLSLVLLLTLVCIYSGSAACTEAGTSSAECEAGPDTTSIGSSLLQSHKVSSTLAGELHSDLDTADTAGKDSSEAPTSFSLSLLEFFGNGISGVRPSLSLLQDYSAGSGMSRTFESQPETAQSAELSLLESQPRRHKVHAWARQSSAMHQQMQSIFFLVPMGACLVACCLIISLVYCCMSGERAEDERLAKILGRIEPGSSGEAKRGGPAIDPKIHAQSHQSARKVSETPENASSAQSSSSVSTAATGPVAAREETAEDSSAEAPSADEAAGVATSDNPEVKGGLADDD